MVENGFSYSFYIFYIPYPLLLIYQIFILFLDYGLAPKCLFSTLYSNQYSYCLVAIYSCVFTGEESSGFPKQLVYLKDIVEKYVWNG